MARKSQEVPLLGWSNATRRELSEARITLDEIVKEVGLTAAELSDIETGMIARGELCPANSIQRTGFGAIRTVGLFRVHRMAAVIRRAIELSERE